MEISNRTIEELKKAGWYEGRKIDISETVRFLEERGFEVFESAKNSWKSLENYESMLKRFGEMGLSKYLNIPLALRK